MSGILSAVFLPDGQSPFLPITPRNWADAGAATLGDPLRAPLITLDASATVMWMRQRPLFHGIQTGAQSIPASTWTAITGLGELTDNWSGHSDTTNTGRYYPPNTVTFGDWYLCSGLVPFNTSSTADAHIAGIRVNGGTVYEGAKLPGGTGHGLTVPVVDLIQLDGSTDYVELGAWHNEAGAINTLVSNRVPSLQVRWVCINPSVMSTAALPGAPHTWTGTDILTATATGANKVPLNTELRDVIRYLINPPVFRVHTSGTSQTIPSGAGTWTAFTWQGESVDNYGMWSSGASVTCQRAGLYYIAGTGAVTETSTKAGYRAIRIHHTIAAGGTADYYGISAQPMTGTKTTGTSLIADAFIRLAVNDTVQLQFDHTNGSALSVVSSASNGSRLVGAWVAK